MQTAADLNSLQVCVYFSARQKDGAGRISFMASASSINSRLSRDTRSRFGLFCWAAAVKTSGLGKIPRLNLNRMKTDRLTALSLSESRHDE